MHSVALLPVVRSEQQSLTVACYPSYNHSMIVLNVMYGMTAPSTRMKGALWRADTLPTQSAAPQTELCQQCIL